MSDYCNSHKDDSNNDDKDKCDHYACGREFSYKVHLTNKTMNGIIRNVCSTHIVLYSILKENDECIIESVLRSKNPDMVMFLDRLDKNKLVQWLYQYIEEKDLYNIDSGSTCITIKKIIRFFENLDCISQSRLKKIIMELEAQKGDAESFFQIFTHIYIINGFKRDT